MKLAVRKFKNKKQSGNLEYIKVEKNLKEFVGSLKNTMITNGLV
jgi:hypothetical protein